MVDVAKLLEPVTKLRQRHTAPLVLELDLTEGITDEMPGDALGQIMAMRRPRLADVEEGLRRGARDPRVKALVARVGGRPIGVATTQELRAAIQAFRAAGKPAVAWADSFGEFGPGNLPYYLACAFDEIAVQPSGNVGLAGLRVVNTFVRDLLEKVGVEYEAGIRHEYKNAMNTFTERGFTEPHREATERLAQSYTEQIVEGVAEGRGLSVDEVRSLVDRGPFLAAEALEAGLVDRAAYRDEVYAELLDRFRDASGDGADPTLQFVNRYLRAQSLRTLSRQATQRDAYVALISAVGPVMPGRSRRSPLGGGSAMGAETVSAAFRHARRDPRVRAVVFRIDSPGGSYVASDTIWREVKLTSEAGKPVVASMGDVAGSGGYFVALSADVIVAQPGTLTGSIGVYLAKPVLSALLDRAGINVESVQTGENAGMTALTRKFTDSEWSRVNAMLDHVYADFTAKVALSRGMTAERVHELARGRVWTGRDAHERGLVDELGGTRTALRLAREKAGLPESAQLRPYPRLGPLERFVPAESSEDRTAAARLRLNAWGPLADVAAKLGLPATGPLTMPGTWVIE